MTCKNGAVSVKVKQMMKIGEMNQNSIWPILV